MVDVIQQNLAFLKYYCNDQLRKATYVPFKETLANTSLVCGQDDLAPPDGFLISKELFALVNTEHGLVKVKDDEKGLEFGEGAEIHYKLVGDKLSIWAGENGKGREFDIAPHEPLDEGEQAGALLARTVKNDPILRMAQSWEMFGQKVDSSEETVGQMATCGKFKEELAKGQLFKLQQPVKGRVVRFENTTYPIDAWILTPTSIYIGNLENQAWDRLATCEEGWGFDIEDELHWAVVGPFLDIWGTDRKATKTFIVDKEHKLDFPFDAFHLTNQVHNMDPRKEKTAPPNGQRWLRRLTAGQKRLELTIPESQRFGQIETYTIDTVVLTENRLLIGNRENDMWHVLDDKDRLAMFYVGQPQVSIVEDALYVWRTDKTAIMKFPLAKSYTCTVVLSEEEKIKKLAEALTQRQSPRSSTQPRHLLPPTI